MERQARVAYIDGLRAVAVLSVVLCHTVELSAPGGRAWLEHVLREGRHGVDLFFVLSGFCLSYPTIARMRIAGGTLFDIPKYAAHRVVRIVPPYWIAIAFLAFFAVALQRLGYALPDGMPHPWFTSYDVIRQALFLDAGVKFLNVSFWTLPVEFRWYFLFPILLFVWTKSAKAFLPITVVSLLLLATRSSSIDALYLPAFMLGIVAADLKVRGVAFGRFTHPATLLAIAGAIISDLDQLWFLASFALLLSAGRSNWIQRVLSVRWLTMTGVASYSIYLVHAPLMSFARSVGATPLLAAVLGVGCGFIFWFFAERPFTSTRLRAALVGQFDTAFRKWLPGLGIPALIQMGRVQEPSEANNRSLEPVGT